MKKRLFYVILVFAAGFLIILTIPSIFKSMQKDNTVFIQYEQMKEMLEKEEDFFLIISREGCLDCTELKEELGNSKDNTHTFYIFEYEADQSEMVVDELQDIFPNFILVPYICHINNGSMEVYSGEVELNKIFEWMDRVQNSP